MKQIEIQDIPLWDKKRKKQAPFSWDMELTARCNNNCRHCYINLPVNDQQAKGAELSLSEIEKIADEAIELGALWCTITGGEPLYQEYVVSLIDELLGEGYQVSIETNGTIPIPFINNMYRNTPLSWVMDYKLGLINDPKIFMDLRKNDFIKFVVNSLQDLSKAFGIQKAFQEKVKCSFAYSIGDYDKLTPKNVLQAMQTHNIDGILNIQIHKLLGLK